MVPPEKHNQFQIYFQIFIFVITEDNVETVIIFNGEIFPVNQH